MTVRQKTWVVAACAASVMAIGLVAAVAGFAGGHDATESTATSTCPAGQSMVWVPSGNVDPVHAAACTA